MKWPNVKKKEIYAVDQHKTPASSCSAVVSETVIFILSSRMNITRQVGGILDNNQLIIFVAPLARFNPLIPKLKR